MATTNFTNHDRLFPNPHIHPSSDELLAAVLEADWRDTKMYGIEFIDDRPHLIYTCQPREMHSGNHIKKGTWSIEVGAQYGAEGGEYRSGRISIEYNGKVECSPDWVGLVLRRVLEDRPF